MKKGNKREKRILEQLETLDLLERKGEDLNSMQLSEVVFLKLEWRFGGFKNKDGKGTQIAPFECTAEEGS